jgi:hypothetical protein
LSNSKDVELCAAVLVEASVAVPSVERLQSRLGDFARLDRVWYTKIIRRRKTGAEREPFYVHHVQEVGMEAIHENCKTERKPLPRQIGERFFGGSVNTLEGEP